MSRDVVLVWFLIVSVYAASKLKPHCTYMEYLRPSLSHALVFFICGNLRLATSYLKYFIWMASCVSGYVRKVDSSFDVAVNSLKAILEKFPVDLRFE